MVPQAPSQHPYHPSQNYPDILGVPIDSYITEAQLRLAVDYLHRSKANTKDGQIQKVVLLRRLRTLAMQNGKGRR